MARPYRPTYTTSFLAALGLWSLCAPGCSDPIENGPGDGEAGTLGVGATAGTEGESGSGGEAGALGGSGGSAGDPFAQGGEAGVPAGDTTPPTVVAFSPEDGSANVERELVISIELSEAVEPTRVPAALRVLGPEGPIPGEIVVDDNIVTFEPDSSLIVLGEYTVSLDTTLADLAGNRLDGVSSTTFRVRDGAWGRPERPFDSTEFRSVRASAGNRRGDLFVAGHDDSMPPRAWGAVFDSTTRSWTDPTVLAADETLTAHVRSAALSESGAAVIAWWLGNTTSPGGWNRYSSTNGFSDSTPLINTFAQLTATNQDNYAMLVSQNESRFVYYTLQDLGSQTFGAVAERGDNDETLHALVSSSKDFVLIASRTLELGSYELLAVRHDRAQGFAEPEPIASGNVEQLGVLATSDELGNITVAWSEGLELWARIYDADSAEWLEAEQVSEGASARWSSLAMSGGHLVASFSALGELSLAYRDKDGGWLEEGTVPLGRAEPGALTIDARGNALAVWNDTGDYRRYVSGEGWQPIESLELDSDAASFGAFTTRTGELSLVAVEVSDGNSSPLVIPFR